MILSPHQREQVNIATSGRIGILIGDPGTGKSYTAAAIIKDAAIEYGVHNLRACAPTGKAAVRLTQALQTHKLDLEATTIHRMLAVTKDHTGWKFRHDASNPLAARMIVVDEPSMLGTDLAACLFAAVRPDCRVLLTGDTGQLPPVGHGAVLRDMLAAGFPCGRLTELWRNGGDIVTACQAIRTGRPWGPSESIDIDAGHNLLHRETRTPTATRGELKTLLERLPEQYDRRRDVQVLVAINDNTPLARIAINEALQHWLNPRGAGDPSHAFRVDDKVMCLRNQIMKSETAKTKTTKAETKARFNAYFTQRTGKPRSKGHDEFVANGDLGVVTEVGRKVIKIQFAAPERLCTVRGLFLKDICLAYATTVHKSQGSQWPIVIYLSDDARSARFVASRELLYTAFSRAETLAVTIGRKTTMDADCQREVLSKRKTFLKERLTA